MKIRNMLILLVLVLLAVTVVLYGQGQKTLEYSVEYDKEELAWLNDHADFVVYYNSEVEETATLALTIRSIELLTHLRFVAIEADDPKMSEAILIRNLPGADRGDYISSRSISTLGASYYEKAEALVTGSSAALYTGALFEERDMVVKSGYAESKVFKFFGTLNEMMASAVRGEIGGFILIDERDVLSYDEEELFYSTGDMPLVAYQTRIYTRVEQGILAEVLDRTLRHMSEHRIIAQIELEQVKKDESRILWQILSDEEKMFINDSGAISIGIEEVNPWIIKQTGKLYGLPIGFFHEVSQLTGLQFDYVIGDSGHLMANADVYDMAALWLKNDTSAYTKGAPFVHSDYVVAGIGKTPSIGSMDAMSMMQVGTVFSDDISSYLVEQLPMGTVELYKTSMEMLKDLQSGALDVMVLPRVEFDFYDQNEDQQSMDIRLVLDRQFMTKVHYTDEAIPLQSIMDKVILVQKNHPTNYSSQSLIPEPVDPTAAFWAWAKWVLLGTLMVVIPSIIVMLISRREKRQMNYLFTHDQLTYLPNRYGLKKHIDQSIELGDKGLIVMMDIDNMKEINDRLGHQYGNQVIVEFSQVLMGLVDEDVILGRSGGDEFVLVIKNRVTVSEEELIHKIKDLVKQYGMTKKELYSFTVSTTATTYPEYNTSYDHLYSYLEYTLEYSKNNQGSNAHMTFSHDIYNNYLEEQVLVKEITKGLENDEFVLYVQPQITLPTEELYGGEILIRWEHPKRGLLFPDAFLPVAEKNGLMREIDFYIFEKACHLIKAWQDNYDKLSVSVNMSVATFEDDTMPKKFKALLGAVDFDASWLTVEVTEDMGLKNMERADCLFKEFRSMGIRVALDDFGKGYSSLGYLEKLTIDVLKIDKTFIDNIHVSKKSLEIFKAIVRLAEVMKISVVAEGVEYLEQVEILRTLGAPIIQGYYYSKPVCVEEFVDFVHRYETMAI